MNNLSNNDINDIISSSFQMIGEPVQHIPEENTNNNTSTQVQNIEEHNTEEPPAITPNSMSHLVDEASSRFSSALWYDNIKSKHVILAGIGGIGSFVAFLLSRLQVAHITMYDSDIVETANMSGQLYNNNNIGAYKVDALCDTLSSFSSYNSVFCINENFTQYTSGGDIMICGFDNMEARKIFFNKWLENVFNHEKENRKKCLFIDGRLNAEEFQVLCIQGNDEYNIQRYQNEFLFDDSEVEEAVCSYKQTTFMANMIGSVMINLFVNFAANECNPIIDRDLPFYTYYTAETMYFKTEQ